MLKAPVPGQVKTRLAQSIGDDQACEAYRQMIEHSMDVLSRFSKEIHGTPVESLEVFRNWLGSRYPNIGYYGQCDGGLGVRMKYAVRAAFERGAESVALLGGDCPYVTDSILKAGQEALKSHDVVIGPSPDGGYYTLMLKRAFDVLFEGIVWSTASVLDETLSIAKKNRLKTHLLEPLEDIDDAVSWKRYCEFKSTVG